MTYTAQMLNGQVVFDGPAPPEGTKLSFVVKLPRYAKACGADSHNRQTLKRRDWYCGITMH